MSPEIARGRLHRAHAVGAPRSRRPWLVTAVVFACLACVVMVKPVVGSLAAFSATAQSTNDTLTTDTLSPPTSLVAIGGTTVTLDWTATTDTYATGHRVFRATASGGPYVQIAEISPNTTTTYVDNPPSGTYYYRARAYFANWESADSNEVSATVSTAPTFDASSSRSGTGTTQSWSHTIGSGSNRVLIVTTSSVNEQANSVTFNGAALTLVGRQVDADNASRISIWYRVNPATGPGTIQVTFAGSAEGKTMGASSWSGVHQSVPVGAFASASGTSGTPSVTVASAVGEVVVDAVSNEGGGSITVHPSQVERWNATLLDVSGGHSSEAGATSVTMSWTMPSAYWAIGAVPLKPA